MAQLKDFQTGAVGDSFNGPIGTSTAAAGAFTTLAASGAVTLSGGTANGVTYLNGSKVLTSGSALVFDGTNLGVGNASSRTLLDVLSGTANTTGDVLGQAIITGPDVAPAGTGGSGNLVIQTNSNQAANVGGSIAFGGRATDSSTVGRGYAVIKGAKENSTSANRDGYFAIFTRSEASGQAEKARFNSTGAMVFAGGTTTANGIGITFPATQSASTDANTLDDYEEGTWTTTHSTSLNMTGTPTFGSGRYTKIGRTVNLTGVISGTVASSNTLTYTIFNGLPFTPAATFVGTGYADTNAKIGASQVASNLNFYVYFPAASAITAGAENFYVNITYVV
jgi:hypothetical protein